jgi:hypothetical protein
VSPLLTPAAALETQLRRLSAPAALPLLVAHFLLKMRSQRPVWGGRVGGGAHQSAVRSLHAACTSVRAGFSGTHLHTCPFLSCCRDDALWALDGLAAGSAGAARDSLAALAEICAAKRGRLALRSANLASDVLAAAGASLGGWVPLWHCVALLHCGCPIIFAAAAAVVLLPQTVHLRLWPSSCLRTLGAGTFWWSCMQAVSLLVHQQCYIPAISVSRSWISHVCNF